MKYIGLHCHKKYDYATMIDIELGDTSAQVDLPTKTDSWNLVYIILSFRSETTTGGTITYLIRGYRRIAPLAFSLIP